MDANTTVATPAKRAEGKADVCWSTVAGISLIHLGGVAGIVWIVLEPSLKTLALAAIYYAACGCVLGRDAIPSTRWSSRWSTSRRIWIA